MTLYDLMIKSGMLEVFPTSSAEEAYAKSVFVGVSWAGVPMDMIGTHRVGDDLTIVVDIDD